MKQQESSCKSVFGISEKRGRGQKPKIASVKAMQKFLCMVFLITNMHFFLIKAIGYVNGTADKNWLASLTIEQPI